MEVPIRDTGLSIVYEPDSGSPIVDIVIVHGLQGHPYKTWACKDPGRDVPSAARLSVEAPNDGNRNRKSYHRVVSRFSGKSSRSSSIGLDSNQRQGGVSRGGGNVKETRVFWPKDLLPVRYPDSRVLVYGYDTRVTNYLSGPTNENSIHSHGKDLLSSLAASRKLDSPLILIAHSLGGIVAKEMLAGSSNSTEHRLRNVVASTAAVVFLGTPHRGSADLAKLGGRARSMISALRMKTNPAILDALMLKTKDLERAQESFSIVWNRYNFRVKTFQEGLGLTGVNFGPFGKKVVPDDSSLLGDVRERAETIQANHMEMCRFTGLDDPNYERLCGEITEIYDSIAGLNATTVHRIHECSLTASGLTISSHDSRSGAMDERKKTCLQSLIFPNMNQRTRNLENPAEGTCSWLFEHELFIDWITGKNQTQSYGLLWVRGKPGSGKSTLLKEAFSRSTITMSSSKCHVMSFFFNAKGEDLEHSPTGMLRSIVHQMCSQNADLLGALLDFAQSRRAICGEEMTSWEEAELRAFFNSAIVSHKERVIIFIDAIDECDSNSVRDVAHFWRETTKTAHHVGVQLSVCLSSRHYPAITVSNCPEIIMEDHNYPDIVGFVGRQLDLGMNGKPEDRKAIQQKILEKSGGVFLWVSLVVKDVLRKRDEGRGLKRLLKDLDSVPPKLEDLFRQLLTTGPSSTMVARMFQWALLPSKPLRLHEWHHILAFIGDTPSSLRQWRQSDFHTGTDEQLEKRITHLSRGLLDFNIRSSNDNSHESDDESMSERASAGSLDVNTGETRVVQVIHESVRQYFMGGPGFAVLNPAFAEKPLGQCHLSMMNVCLDYILIAELDALVGARERAHHAQEGSGRYHNGGPGLLRSTMSHTSDALATHPLDKPPALCEPRVLARRGSTASVASFGSAGSHDGETQRRADDTNTSTFLRHLHKAPELKSLDKLSGLKSLDKFSAKAHEFTSTWLEDQSVTDQAYCDVPAAHASQQTSLTSCTQGLEDYPAAHASQQTSVTGCTQVLEDYPALLSYATFELFTHAQKANAEGLDPSHIIRRLHDGAWDRWKALREDVDEQIELLYFVTDLGLSSWLKADMWKERQIYLAMELAIENKNAEVFKKLLGAFPWERCVANTSSMILRLAVATDAALLQAFLSWHPSTTHNSRGLVTAKKNTLASGDKKGRTALHLAIIQQNKDGVSLLLKHGADVSEIDYQLRTPLHLACMKQSKTTKIFTDNVSMSDGILEPRSDIIELLLDHDADIDAADEEEAMTLRALKYILTGMASVLTIEVLLERGANAMKRDHMSFLPLHEACWNSSSGRQSKVSVAKKLLDCGSPVNAAGVRGGTPLHIACSSSDVETVEELLRQGADPRSQDYIGRSPLHIAVAKSTEQVVETLLSSPRTSVDATDISEWTPLHMACNVHLKADQDKATALSVIRRLLAHGARAYTPRDRSGDSPVDVARSNGFKEALMLLAEDSCDAPPLLSRTIRTKRSA